MDELLSNQQELLPRRIHFLPEQRPDLHNESLQLRFVPINRVVKKELLQENEGLSRMKGINGDELEEKRMDAKGKPQLTGEQYLWSVRGAPKVVLSNKEDHFAYLPWKKVNSIGCGLRNIGNTCFLNSSLQCLAYIPVLAQLCLDRRHSSQCDERGFCLLCNLERLVIKMHSKNARDSFIPRIAGLIRQVSRNFRHGRQEDAHEFVHFAIEHIVKNSARSELLALKKNGMHRNVPKKLTDMEIDTCNLARIFTGVLQSQVKCMNPRCGYESNRYETFTDLSLEIGGKGGNSVERALSKFCRIEVLDADNMYRCDKCNKKTRAHKQFTFLDLPSVLIVHLKRFSGIHGKITKKVAYGNKLSLNRFMSSHADAKTGDDLYSLCGVLVHLGHTQHSGHYICFVKSSAGIWYEMDDDSVTKVSEKNVLSQQAYLLFYTKTTVSMSTSVAHPKSVANGRQLSNGSPALSQVSVNGLTAVKKDSPNNTGDSKKAWKSSTTQANEMTAGTVLGKKRSREEANVNVQWNGLEADGKEAEKKKRKQERKQRKQKKREEKRRLREEKKEEASKPTNSTPVTKSRSPQSSAPVQKWDEFVQHKNEDAWSSGAAKQKRPEVAAWNAALATLKKRRALDDDVAQWSESPELEKQRRQIAEQLDREIASSKPAPRDKWDLDYDKPKTKKVRSKAVSLFESPKKENPFQHALQVHKARRKSAKAKRSAAMHIIKKRRKKQRRM